MNESCTIKLPWVFKECPKYWQNFITDTIHDKPNKVKDILLKNYNVIKYDEIFREDETIREIRELVFKSREDLLYFILKWS